MLTNGSSNVLYLFSFQQLMDLILWVLEQEDDLHYYQGYHDICVTVLQVCGARLGSGF